MPNLFLKNINSQPVQNDGVGVQTQAVFDRLDHPIHLHVKTLAPNARLDWENVSGSFLAFVWEGSVSIGGVRLTTHSAFVIERGARAVVIATEEGAQLLLFGGGSDMQDESDTGGKVHVLPAQNAVSTDDLYANGDVGATLWIDADCPSCSLWLHGNHFKPGFVVRPHHHDETEIIVVMSGTILIGSKEYGRGSALQVSKFSEYTFKSGDDGLSYIVFHPRAPQLISTRNEPVDEKTLYHHACGTPQSIYIE